MSHDEDEDLFDILEELPDPPSNIKVYNHQKFERGCHHYQKQVLRCQESIKCILAGRQSGKTQVDAMWLLGGNRGQKSLYFAETITDAWKRVADVFDEIDEKFHLDLKIIKGKSQIIEPNGHIIEVSGVKDLSQAKKFRGKKFRRIVIDEASLYSNEALKSLIEEILPATLFKWGGEILINGTPDIDHQDSYWYELCGDPYTGVPGRYKTFHWTLYDNPYVNPEKVIRDLKLDPDSASFQREQLARWVADRGALVYPWEKGINGTPENYPHGGFTVIGVDFGVNPAKTAFVVLRMQDQPQVHVLKAYKIGSMTPHEVGEQLEILRKQFQPNWIMVDGGGLGSGYALQLNDNFGLGVEKAYKPGKLGRIQNIKGAIKNNFLVVHPEAQELLDEWRKIIWNLKKIDHDSRKPDDLSDAMGYAMMKMYQTYPYAPPMDPRTALEIERERRKESARIAAMGLRSGLF